MCSLECLHPLQSGLNPEGLNQLILSPAITISLLEKTACHVTIRSKTKGCSHHLTCHINIFVVHSVLFTPCIFRSVKRHSSHHPQCSGMVTLGVLAQCASRLSPRSQCRSRYSIFRGCKDCCESLSLYTCVVEGTLLFALI